MDPAALTAHAAVLVTIAVTLRYGADAVLRLVAGVTAILARDQRTTRAERAFAVLRTLRGVNKDRHEHGPESAGGPDAKTE